MSNLSSQCDVSFTARSGTDRDGAPTDFNIREDFPVEALERALAAFAAGRGASIMTITCADAETYENAKRDPEKYDLLRARMGAGPSSS